MIQLAWLWLRHQPTSELSLWFRERVKRNGGRGKKTAIVALARKLLVALWKFSSSGVVIEGAMMKLPERSDHWISHSAGSRSGPDGSRRANRKTAWPQQPSLKNGLAS